MRILSIETSCDETGICLLEKGADTTVTLLGNALASQIDIHSQYGGVFPMLAKRAHTEKIIPLLTDALEQSNLSIENRSTIGTHAKEQIASICTKDTQLADILVSFLNAYQKPDIDYIAVTVGPGLEPALWVGVNTARTLAKVWNIPLIPINHMEGHFVTAAFVKKDEKVFELAPLHFPALALLVSGGHSELVLADAFGSYKKLGQTRDDAVGEAFDKVARMLGLSYPGGPAVSKLAATFRETDKQNPFNLPRPMLHSGDYDFSFSGIKTAVLYAIRDHGELTDDDKMALAGEFETAAVEVLVKKTINAAKEYNTQTIIVGGGVAGNIYLRNELSNAVEQKLSGVTLLFPEPWLATDNAIMIGMAAMAQALTGQIKTSAPTDVRADGNLSL